MEFGRAPSRARAQGQAEAGAELGVGEPPALGAGKNSGVRKAWSERLREDPPPTQAGARQR